MAVKGHTITLIISAVEDKNLSMKISAKWYLRVGLTALLACCYAIPLVWAKKDELSKTSSVKSNAGPRIVEIGDDAGAGTEVVSQSPDSDSVSSEVSPDQISNSLSDASAETALNSSYSDVSNAQTPEQEELERQQRAESFRRLAEALRRLAESHEQPPSEKSQ